MTPGVGNRRTIERRSGIDRRRADRRTTTERRFDVERTGAADRQNRRSTWRRVDYRRSLFNRRAAKQGGSLTPPLGT